MVTVKQKETHEPVVSANQGTDLVLYAYGVQAHATWTRAPVDEARRSPASTFWTKAFGNRLTFSLRKVLSMVKTCETLAIESWGR
jgi:hypothetical protein